MIKTFAFLCVLLTGSFCHAATFVNIQERTINLDKICYFYAKGSSEVGALIIVFDNNAQLGLEFKNYEAAVKARDWLKGVVSGPETPHVPAPRLTKPKFDRM